MRVGRVLVTYSVLAELLKFPPGTNVRNVVAGNGYRLFEVVVEHPDLEDVPDGGPIPVVDYSVVEIRGHFS